MIRLLLIADDLTGALDTGVRLAEQGFKTKVMTYLPVRMDQEDADVLVIDTESRHLSEKEAYGRVKDVFAVPGAKEVPHIYKKTDSALRGNIGAELRAVMDALSEDTAAFIPAYPGVGRITRDGIQYINGVPVSMSEFGRDSFNPLKTSCIKDIIGEQTDIPVHTAKDPGGWTRSPGITVMDAASDADMEAWAEKAGGQGIRVLAGCGGAAAHLRSLIGKGTYSFEIPYPGDGLFVFSGSIHPETKRQTEKAPLLYKRITVPEGLIGEKDLIKTPAGTELIDRLRRVIRENGRVIFTSDSGSAAEDGACTEEIRRTVARNLGDIYREISDLLLDRPVMIVGGDTLRECMDASWTCELMPLGELFPGVVVSEYIKEGKRRILITKSGGMGKDTLFRDIMSL